jgi:UDP-N-acetylmuramoyl-tripeptide--D-alanyl-D-alanine ligase
VKNLKPLQINQIIKVIDGELIKGSNNLLINNVLYFMKEPIKPNTLIFIRNKSQIKYEYINNTPITIVTDNISEEIKSLVSCTIILVKDIETAYWKFIDYYRNLFNIPVIAVTGTCGKTTTKDMIINILSQHFNVQGTKSTANGRTAHLGYLLGIDESTDVGVFETAVGDLGDLTYAFRYFKPKIGVMLNIGIDHLYRCKTQDGYIQAKTEMVTELSRSGILILNADDKNIQRIDLRNFKGTILYFGIHTASDFLASDIKYGENGMNFTLSFMGKKYPIFVPGYGEHQVYNALASIAAVNQIGIQVEMAAVDILKHKNLPHHHQLAEGINGCLILDDTWHSNPTSLEAAFQTLNGIANGKKRVALIGQITHLGSHTFPSARVVGAMIAKEGVDILITVGLTADEIAKEATLKGLVGNIYVFPNIKGVYPFIEKILDENTILLAKCSMYDTPFKKLIKKLK